MPQLELALAPSKGHPPHHCPLFLHKLKRTSSRDVSDGIHSLWCDLAIPEAVCRSRDFQLNDSAVYYLGAIGHTSLPSYIPTAPRYHMQSRENDSNHGGDVQGWRVDCLMSVVSEASGKSGFVVSRTSRRLWLRRIGTLLHSENPTILRTMRHTQIIIQNALRADGRDSKYPEGFLQKEISAVLSSTTNNHSAAISLITITDGWQLQTIARSCNKRRGHGECNAYYPNYRMKSIYWTEQFKWPIKAPGATRSLQ